MSSLPSKVYKVNVKAREFKDRMNYYLESESEGILVLHSQ